MNLHELESAALQRTTRRHFFGQCAVGLGSIALNQLLSADGRAAVNIDAAHPMAERPPHFAPKAKRGGPTGVPAPGRPAFGTWAPYGLGSVSQAVPGFFVLQSGARGPRGDPSLWSSGLSPSSFPGGRLRGQRDPILHLLSPQGLTP